MRSGFCILVALAAVVAIGPASADRVIFSPTGTTLGTAGVKAEAAIGPSNDDAKIYWLGAGIPRLEVNAIRFDGVNEHLGVKDATVIGTELSILPETTLTPGIGVGVWDMTGETERGTGYYLALTKIVPLSSTLPTPIRDLTFHAGAGFSGIDGVFGGAEATIPLGLKLSAEYFQRKFNFAIGWRPIRAIELKAYLLDGDAYYGLQFSTSGLGIGL